MVDIKNVRRRRRNKNAVAVVLTLLSRTLLGYIGQMIICNRLSHRHNRKKEGKKPICLNNFLL